MKRALPVLLAGLVCLPALADGYGIDLYGRSYHGGLPQGERDKLNEANIGFALTHHINRGKHVFTVDAGTYLNSYYDQTYWIGAQYRYQLFKYFEPGLMLRHWETAHDTYPDKLINKYLTVSFPLTETVRVSSIVRSNGAIVYISVDLK